MSDSVLNKNDVRSADFPGDDANLPGYNENPTPGLVVNMDANGPELLSGAIHRLNNAADLMWLVLDRANGTGDDHLEGGIVAMGRLCNEALQLCEVLMGRLEPIKRPVQTGKAGKVPK
jgi:hypothetical protein